MAISRTIPFPGMPIQQEPVSSYGQVQPVNLYQGNSLIPGLSPYGVPTAQPVQAPAPAPTQFNPNVPPLTNQQLASFSLPQTQGTTGIYGGPKIEDPLWKNQGGYTSQLPTGTQLTLDRNLPTPVPQAPQPQPQPAPAQNVQQAFSNIIQTGKATTPPPTQTAPQQQMATLVNPKTGDRKAVPVGSQEAQGLFGQGYILENQAPSTSTATVNTNINNQTTNQVQQQTQKQPASRIPFLRGEADKVRQEAFTTVYGYTPDEWQNLYPEAQRRLRNQRVQGLAGQLGNLNSAIQQAQQEEASAKSETQKARANALDTLNVYLKYGVLNKLSLADKQTLASTAGCATDALDAIAEQSDAKPVELKTLGADLYQVSYDENGQPSVKLLASGKSSGGGGGGSGAPKTTVLAGIEFPKEFADWYQTYFRTPGTPVDPVSVQAGYEQWIGSVVKEKVQGKSDPEAQDRETLVSTIEGGVSTGKGAQEIYNILARNLTTISQKEIVNTMANLGVDTRSLKF